jgi:hypothetical protein
MAPRPAILRPDATVGKVRLNVDTWRWVRIRAAEQHTTMSAVVEEALQEKQARDDQST